ncbi:MAG: hypothetical protein WD187_04225 [Candidatus Woykebacteria bacterium]
MKRLEFAEKHNLVDVLNALKNEPDKDIEIFIFAGSEILKNPTNRTIINLQAAELGKKISIKGDEGIKPIISGEQPKQEGQPDKNLGFVEGKDVVHEAPPASTPGVPPEKKGKFTLPKLPKLAFVDKFFKGPRWIYFLIGLLALLFAGTVLAFWLVPSATVTLRTEERFQEAELTLVASPAQEEIDMDKVIIPLKTVEATVDDVLEVKATGTKTVGTSAKGRIKIVNRDSKSAKTFFKGTTITTVSGAKVSFTLDNIATVSAAPVGCEDCPSAGVDVTATSIGEEGNLKTGTVFRVGSANVNLVFAKSETNFTGGSSKKITVVSANDQKKAKQELLKKLEEEARKQIEEENPDVTIPEGGLETEIVNETYSKDVGDEAGDFRISLEVGVTTSVFSEEDLKDLLIGSISDSVPSGFEVDREKSIVESEILEKGEEDIKVTGKIKASLVPKIDKEELARNISGKDFGTTDKHLKSIASISGFEIKLNPPFFRIFGTMPLSASRINVEVAKEE